MLTRFSFDLAWWPSFSPEVTQFWTWTRNLQDKHFEQDSWWLIQKRDLQSINKVFLWFGLVTPNDPVSKFDPEIIKTNILSKIHDYCFKNVTARVLTRFSFDLAWWPSFWPQVTQFQTWPRNHQDKHFEQYSWWLLQKCYLWSVNRVFLWFGLVTYFFFPMTHIQTWPRNNQDKHFEQDSWWLLEKMWYLESKTRSPGQIKGKYCWPSFWPQVTQFWST